VPHLRRGLIATKVGHRAKHDPDGGGASDVGYPSSFIYLWIPCQPAVDLRHLSIELSEDARMTVGRPVSVCACLVFGICAASAAPKPIVACKVTFSVAYLDRLNNLNNGIPAANLGTRVYTDNSSSAAAATNTDGSAAAAAASSSSTTAVPYTVDYSVFILDIEVPQGDGTFKILRTLDQKGLYHTIYGIGYGKGKHPLPNIIEAGAQWLHDDYLGNRPNGKW
jgi:hypothetical protein